MIFSVFIGQKDYKSEENSVTALQPYEAQSAQLLNDDEVKAISDIKFLNSPKEYFVAKEHNEYIIEHPKITTKPVML